MSQNTYGIITDSDIYQIKYLSSTALFQMCKPVQTNIYFLLFSSDQEPQLDARHITHTHINLAVSHCILLY